MALGLALATLRRLCVGDRFVRDGRWARKEVMPLASKFTGKRAGILGLGRIGRAIAQRLTAFDMRIAYTGRHAHDDAPYRFEPSLLALARESDILIVAVAGGPGTRGLVDRQVLDALGPQGVLINIARGFVVDELALVDALRERRLGGAGSTYSSTSRMCPKPCSAWSRWCYSPTKPVPRTKRGKKWVG
jgi:hydroxypyruvate reductase